MDLQAEISKRKNNSIVGHTVPVLVEGVSPETNLLIQGRTAIVAPNVDGQGFINKGEGVIGERVPVRIGEIHAYSLVSEITV